MCIDMCKHMCANMWVDLCVDMGIDTCVDMCVDMCTDMCVDMCMGICADPYSMREAVATARHLEKFPQDDVPSALANAVAFEACTRR